jgi:hypothetical protein
LSYSRWEEGKSTAIPILFRLVNPLLPELPLRFLLGQRQSFLINSLARKYFEIDQIEIGRGDI